MRFGLKELKTLWHKIIEIGAANKLGPDQAVQKFLKDMEVYDDKLGFEAQSDNSNVVIQMVQPMNPTPLIDIVSDLSRALAAHLDDIKKIGEFRPLLKEAGEFRPLLKETKGESVPLPELKSAVIKAIDLLTY